jgi:hypothetical protein
MRKRIKSRKRGVEIEIENRKFDGQIEKRVCYANNSGKKVKHFNHKIYVCCVQCAKVRVEECGAVGNLVFYIP